MWSEPYRTRPAADRAGRLLVIGAKAVAALRAGEPLGGHFLLPGVERELPGILSWSTDGGAALELIETPPSWADPGDFGVVAHGTLRDGGQVSLLDALVRTWSLIDRPMSLRAATLAL